MFDEQILTARWVFPGTSPPLQRGVVCVRGDRITAVEAHGRRTPDIDFGNAAIIPGLVNAHTHLDLSGLRGRVPPGPDFTAWLRAIIAHRRQQSNDSITEDIKTGLTESLQYGTTLIGDIAAGGQSWPILAESACWSVVFREILGLPQARVESVWQEAVNWLDEHRDTENCRAGLSPHAPYSVNRALFQAAGITGKPLSIHLAESPRERELLEEHRGPFVDFLREVGAWDENGLAPSFECIVSTSQTAPLLLLAHGNYLDSRIALPPNATIVYCPRTHAAFGHAPHPFREFLARGVRVALGTDSLASNPDLDILAEARFIRQLHPDLPGAKLLRMATLAGAEALGLGNLTGSLEEGKSADLVIVPLANEEKIDAYDLLFGHAGNKARMTMWRGASRQKNLGPKKMSRFDLR
jgi:cytosine/adenosine deaminase-related metal-dependent hydrolase